MCKAYSIRTPETKTFDSANDQVQAEIENREEKMQMKVLGLCCGRKNGNTELMMTEVLKGVRSIEPDAEVEFVNLQDTHIQACVGCETCMKKKLQQDFEFRCIHGVDRDHFHFIEMQMREADAIVVSAPAYNLLPPGIMIKFLNKMHASGDYRRITQGVDICKVGACFSIGGTDWTDYIPNVMRMITMELVGVYDGVVDSVHYDFLPAFQTVMLEPEIMERMFQMGVNVANAVNYKKETGKNAPYRGTEGICAYCHSDLLKVDKEGNVYCPQCNVRADVEVENGKLKVRFTEQELEKSRWAPYGQKLHMDNIGKGHAKAAKGADQIRENFTANYKELVKELRMPVPELKK